MVKIMLYGYNFFSFEKECCEIFIKGSIHSNSEKIDIEKWVKTICEQLASKEKQFKTYLFSELGKISGLFSLVIKKGNDFYIAGDIIRSFPVFFGFFNDHFFITSNLNEYQKQNGHLLIDNNKLEEFIASGFVYGNGTLFKDIYALQAGEIVSIKDYIICSDRYFEFKPTEYPVIYKNIFELTTELDEVLLSIFRRMLEQTPTINRWIVPLSGGHDSRIIVNYLYRLEIKNVICYSYGVSNNEQSGLSKQVAESLGFEWHFVEYTEQKWQRLHEIGIIDEFIAYAFDGVSVPHLQDILAIYELKEKGIVKQNDVFVPGHTFDFLVGSNFGISDLACKNKDMAIERTFLMHSKITKWSHPSVRTIEDIYEKAKVNPRHFQEYFNWQEKRAKFLVNTARGYEFFSFEIRLPFWDKEIVDFWLKVPDNQRMGRKSFFEAEKLGILVNQIISIPFFGKNDRVSISLVEEILRRLLPAFLKTIILRITSRKVKFNAGLNQIYALKANSVRELLEPIEDFPSDCKPYFSDFLDRFPYQIDYHFLTSLYAIRKQFNRNKNL
jgi:asparagine synthase (glutamine-hydrolysing)